MEVLFLICLVGLFTGFPAPLLNWLDSRHQRPMGRPPMDPEDTHYEGPFR
jgi:hypothetical protein